MNRCHKSSALSHPSITPQSLSDINALTLHTESKNTKMCLNGPVLILHSHRDLHLFVRGVIGGH